MAKNISPISTKKLASFDKTELEEIINSLAASNRIFNCEAQFQFELAQKIKNQFNCKVLFEGLSRKYNGKKYFTDLILYDEVEVIAIELKYKTASLCQSLPCLYGEGCFDLAKHGAVDLGRYDYLLDIERIQKIVDSASANDENVIIPCNRGYAVILTNEKKYWDGLPNNTIDAGFFFTQQAKMVKKGTHDWKKSSVQPFCPKTVAGSFRANGLTMNNDYPCDWQDYLKLNTGGNDEFKYLVTEIK